MMLRRLARAASLASGSALILPAAAAAHSLSGRVDSPLPLVAYLAGAAAAVGLSFAFLTLTDSSPPSAPQAVRTVTVPSWLRLLLRAAGLVAWIWIVIQAIVGGASDADVSSLFLWTYGWVGIAIISALVGPIWVWIDPFSTIHDLTAAIGRRLGVSGFTPLAYPRRLGAWPAVVGFAFFVWLELVAGVLGGRLLGVVLVGYTFVTLAGMAQFGRDEWRSRAETFTVWFDTLGRLAPLALAGHARHGRLRRRSFGSGLVGADISTSRLVLVILATGGILYDGLSQTQLFFDLFGQPTLLPGTLLLVTFLGLMCLVILGMARLIGLRAMGSGLIPVAAGYLIAHYLTLLLVDGQRIVIALSDPLQQGWDLLGTAFFEPSTAWLPASFMWAVQLAAVVGGHVVGAWAGHTAVRDQPIVGGWLGQLPLAIVMIGLTTATLWSLGQAVVFTEPGATAMTVWPSSADGS